MKFKELLKIIFTLGLKLFYDFLKEYFSLNQKMLRNMKKMKKSNFKKKSKKVKVDEANG